MAAIAVMAILTVFDVFLRYTVRMPIAGSYELVSFLGAVGMSLALPHLQARNGHIVVDFLTNMLPHRSAGLIKIAILLLTGLVMAIITWRMGISTRTIMVNNQVSDILSIPMWFVYAAVTVGPAATVLICIDQLLLLVGGESNDAG